MRKIATRCVGCGKQQGIWKTVAEITAEEVVSLREPRRRERQACMRRSGLLASVSLPVKRKVTVAVGHRNDGRWYVAR